MTENQVSQVNSYRTSQMLKADRGALPDPEDVVDPSSWPYNDDVWPYGDWPSTGSEAMLSLTQEAYRDAMTLADFHVGPREIKCDRCWQIHRADIDCEGIPR